MFPPANKVKCTFQKVLPINSTFSSHRALSSSPWWLHCVPVMWNGIPTGGLQESGVLHWEHWNRCCHELDHGPYGWPRCAEQWNIYQKEKPKTSYCSAHSSCSPLSDWLQISQPLWCCQAAALALGPHPQRASLRSTWQLLSPWASAETRQPKHFEPRLESNSVQFELVFTNLAFHLSKVKCATTGAAAPFLIRQWSNQVFVKLANSNQCSPE